MIHRGYDDTRPVSDIGDYFRYVCAPPEPSSPLYPSSAMRFVAALAALRAMAPPLVDRGKGRSCSGGVRHVSRTSDMGPERSVRRVSGSNRAVPLLTVTMR